MNRLAIAATLLGLCGFSPESPAQSPARSLESFPDQRAIALQGVWAWERPEDPDLDPDPDLTMARLIVHGSYFLLIYQWSGQDVRVLELSRFHIDDDYIVDAEGNRLVRFLQTSPRTVSFEVPDQSPEPIARWAEFEVTRKGLFPDLKLGRQ